MSWRSSKQEEPRLFFREGSGVGVQLAMLGELQLSIRGTRGGWILSRLPDVSQDVMLEGFCRRF